jgi:hypothetical protein
MTPATGLEAVPRDTGLLVDATGTRRRIQALIAFGWPLPLITDLLYVSWSLRNLAELDLVPRNLQLRTRQIYNRLSMIQPAGHCPPDQTARARSYARRRGWDPPFAWDDETIDDPAAQPADWAVTIDRRRDEHVDEIAVLRRAQGDKKVQLTLHEAAEVVLLCRTWQMSERQIELRTGLKPNRYVAESHQQPSSTKTANTAAA